MLSCVSTYLSAVCVSLSLRAGEELKEKQAEAREAQKEAREVARENQAVLRQVSQAEAAIAEAERDVQQVRGRRCTACGCPAGVLPGAQVCGAGRRDALAGHGACSCRAVTLER